NAEDANIGAYLREHRLKPQLIGLGSGNIAGEVLQVGDSQFDLAGTSLRGRHNQMNALFAIQAAKLWGADDAAIQRGLDTFVSVEHRMEIVGTVAGVEYINDSKATNVDAVYYALEAMT
ncbi:cyanophycin synthetase, partial [Arthrospira platensis SPKY1]|nr:cyanophycin synthetase [Arthrospira platensis SPKY1]